MPWLYGESRHIFMPRKETMEQSDQAIKTKATRETPSRTRAQKALYCLVISSMMLSLSIVIKEITEFIPFLNMPRGGSISLVMVPLVLVGLYCGPVYGIGVPLLFSVYNFFRDGVSSWTPNVPAVLLSLLLDYLIAFGIIGISSLFRKPFYEKKSWAPIAAMTISCLLRFISHFFSGIIIFNNLYDYKGPMTPDWTIGGVTFSAIYNGSYMLPTMLLGIVILALMMKPLFATLDLRIVKTLAPKNLTVTQDDSFHDSLTSGINLAEALCVGTDLLISFLTLIPVMKFGLVAYATLVLSVILIAVEIRFLIGDIKRKDRRQILFDATILFFALVSLVLSCLSIAFVYTRYFDLYKDILTKK